jgi:hypothetical protein
MKRPPPFVSKKAAFEEDILPGLWQRTFEVGGKDKNIRRK